MNTEILNTLKEKAHTWAVGHGFYATTQCDMMANDWGNIS